MARFLLVNASNVIVNIVEYGAQTPPAMDGANFIIPAVTGLESVGGTFNVLTWIAQQAKALATSDIDTGALQGGTNIQRIVRCVALVALDATNNDRQAFTDMNAAVQAAASLADLKTRFAAITFPPQVTAAQLVTAVKAKIAATAE
jgi:hypothetical protein